MGEILSKDFQAYSWTLNSVTSFKYMGPIMIGQKWWGT